MPCAIWGYLEESQQKVILNIKFSLSRKWGAKCWEKDPSEDLRYYYCAKFHSSRSQTRRALIQVWMKYIQVAMLSRDFTAWNISLLLDAVVSSVHFCAYYANLSQSKTKQVWKKVGVGVVQRLFLHETWSVSLLLGSVAKTRWMQKSFLGPKWTSSS